MAESSSASSVTKPRFKLPPMGEVGMYDGTEPAERWLKRLEVLFAGANNGETVDPSTFIKIVDISLVRSAAAFADSSAHLRQIMKRAGEGKAVDEDLNVVIRLLQDKSTDNATNPELRQGESEVLEAYYSRCQSLVLRSGGRDKPLDPSDTLTQAEGYILRDFIFKFVNGLYDKNLMQEAIGQSALAVDSLRQAMEVVTQAASILEAKATSAKLSAKNTRTALMEELIASHLGCSADEALSRAYQLPPGFMETFGGNSQPAPVSVNSLLTQLQPSIAQYRSSARNWENAASQQLHVVPFTKTNRSPQVARTSKLPQSIRISRLLQHIKSPIALVSLNHTGREPAQRGANPMTQLSPRSHMRDRPYVQPESQRINTSTGPLHCHEASFAIDVVFQVILLQSVLQSVLQPATT
ncbi:hypothetical protein E4U28_000808 [Claviceps purpurea]|nr:hypothetical protein E4U28_000808 [Claviceps purpurea]